MVYFSNAFDRLKSALRKTAQIFETDVRGVSVRGRLINEEFLKEFKAKLLAADNGVKETNLIMTTIRERWQHGRIKYADQCLAVVREIISLQN